LFPDHYRVRRLRANDHSCTDIRLGTERPRPRQNEKIAGKTTNTRINADPMPPSMGAAMLFHEGSTVFVVFNALRLLAYRAEA